VYSREMSCGVGVAASSSRVDAGRVRWASPPSAVVTGDNWRVGSLRWLLGTQGNTVAQCRGIVRVGCGGLGHDGRGAA
jgi:hypothetical protein